MSPTKKSSRAYKELPVDLNCRTGKNAYRSRKSALKALDRLRLAAHKHKHFRDSREKLPKTAYRCSECGLWHLTSSCSGESSANRGKSHE